MKWIETTTTKRTTNTWAIERRQATCSRQSASDFNDWGDNTRTKFT
jgi:hypothetical protein